MGSSGCQYQRLGANVNLVAKFAVWLEAEVSIFHLLRLFHGLSHFRCWVLAAAVGFPTATSVRTQLPTRCHQHTELLPRKTSPPDTQSRL